MGCSEIQTFGITPTRGKFLPTVSPEGDGLRGALVEQGEKLEVVAVTGDPTDPDMIMVSGESVMNTVPDARARFGALLGALAFGSEHGEFEPA